MIKKAMGGLLVGAFVLGSATLCQAGMGSENYWIPKSAQPAGGAFMASENYVAGVTLGHTSGIGRSSSSSYDVQAGFWFSVLMKGDVNGDGIIDLADLVLSFQLLAGMSPSDVHRGADVNADGKIGLAETVFILGKAAGLR
ncbi:MAG TPA: hypothetical protein ENN79_04210 [Desulfobacteraceae bacterium]|nr:hypothetical protein [Desulfobacteraceae bacterium]